MEDNVSPARSRFVLLNAYLVGVEIGVENNYSIGSPEINANLEQLQSESKANKVLCCLPLPLS
jgi:hypothetical protein